MATKNKEATVRVTITPPRMETAVFTVVGTAPYVQNAFPGRKRGDIKEAQEAGSTRKKGSAKAPRDFNDEYSAAQHMDAKGKWHGIPAAAFRNAMVTACSLVGFKMAIGKSCLFVLGDGKDSAETGRYRPKCGGGITPQ